jgi:demethylsterigmatocystin 6-O-methyltransferase
MGEGFPLLIDEMIVPSSGAHWQAVELDIMMMAYLAGVERTKEQWDDLLHAGGLTIKEIFTYTSELGHGVMLVRPS